MISQAFLDMKPGGRIQGYRNSAPRFIKLLGVGVAARSIVERIGASRGANVMAGRSGSEEAPDADHGAMDAPVDGVQPHAVIVVLQAGMADAFPFAIERTAAMLSVVQLDGNCGKCGSGGSGKRLRELRSVADLFVSTSDPDFVGELVDNLAS